jgi:prophage tail gpP-like protein
MTTSPISIVFPALGFEVKGCSDFQLHTDFQPPSIASWSFTLEDNIAFRFRAAIQFRTKIQIQINGKPIVTGYVEKLGSDASRLTVSGRCILGRIASHHIDPQTAFKKGMKLKAMLQLLLIPLGINAVEVDDSLNVLAIMGDTGDDHPPKSELGAIALEQCKVKNDEAILTFIDRILLRHGLYMWAKADGSGVVVSKPTYNNTPFHKFTRHLDGIGNTVEKGSYEMNQEGQPSYLVAKGHGKGNGDEDHPRLKSIAVNELLGTSVDGTILPLVQTAIDDPKMKGADVIKLGGDLQAYRYLFGDADTSPPIAGRVHDTHANTQKEISEFVKRRLGEVTAHLFVLHYEVVGHAQSGIPFAINRMVQVDDEVLNVSGAFFVKELTFSQSAGGTRTQATLIIPHCY